MCPFPALWGSRMFSWSLHVPWCLSVPLAGSGFHLSRLLLRAVAQLWLRETRVCTGLLGWEATLREALWAGAMLTKQKDGCGCHGDFNTIARFVDCRGYFHD